MKTAEIGLIANQYWKVANELTSVAVGPLVWHQVGAKQTKLDIQSLTHEEQE